MRNPITPTPIASDTNACPNVVGWQSDKTQRGKSIWTRDYSAPRKRTLELRDHSRELREQSRALRAQIQGLREQPQELRDNPADLCDNTRELCDEFQSSRKQTQELRHKTGQFGTELRELRDKPRGGTIGHCNRGQSF
jgi:uncharacterized coiled-coil DUF342 family protein